MPTITPSLITHGEGIFTGLVVALLVGTPVAAADPDDTPAANTGADPQTEIIVTASRRAEALQDVAIAVSVLDPDEYSMRGLTRLPAILPFVPGVSVQEEGASFGSDVYIRGINSVGAAGVASYIDDIPYGSSTTYAGPGAPIDATLLDLDSISVLKGPQGTLYGASAMGGLIQFVTKEPSLARWTGNTSADLSSTEDAGLNQLYRASVNGPLVGDRLGLSLTGFWNEKTGYIDNIVIPKEGWDDYEYYGGSASLLFEPTERLRIKALALYQNSTQQGRAGTPASNEGVPEFGDYKNASVAVVPSEFETEVFGATLDYDFGWGSLRSITSYQEKTYSESLDATQELGGIVDIFFPATAPHTVLFDSDLGWDKFTQELRLTSVSNQKLEWLVGGYYSKEEGFNIIDVNTIPSVPIFFSSVPSEYSQTSVFGTTTFYFRPNLDVSLGIRYSDNDNTVSLDDGGSILVSGFPPNNVGEEVTTYLFNVRYRPNDNLSMYARAASGFRPGGANFIVRDPGTGQSLTDPFFSADSLWSYDLGLKGTSENGRLSYDLAVFLIDWTDFQVRVNQLGVNVIENADQASSRGVEGSLSVDATDALRLRATVSYINAEFDADEPTLGGPKGSQLPNSPEWSGSADFTYNFMVGATAAYFSGSWHYTGETPVGFDGYVGDDGITYEPFSPRYITPSYSVLNLNTGFQTKRFEASLYVTNLLNDDSWTIFQTDSSGSGAGVQLRPRTYGVVLNAKF